MFEPSLGYAAAIELSQRWARREPSALKKVTRYLAGSGLTVDSVMAQTLASNLDDFERFDRLLASAEARRNSALHEIDRHRTEFGAALRAAADRIEDAEFTDVEPLDSVKLSAA
jgi:oligoribonuclease NrnB/cAMP/cGMP phosphodiesterase (DHH superfamily)